MRSQVVLLSGDRILLACHERADGCYWVLPGGGVEAGETPEEAAAREVREETGLEITIERLLFVDGPREAPGISIKNPRYTYLGRVVGGHLDSIEDLESHHQKGRLTGAAWMPFESAEYDAATRDTLGLVRDALSGLL